MVPRRAPLKEHYRAALSDAQDMTEVLLVAQGKLGGMLKAIPKKPKRNTESSLKGTFGGSESSLPKNITWKESHIVQAMANNPGQAQRAAKNDDSIGWGGRKRKLPMQQIYQELR